MGVPGGPIRYPRPVRVWRLLRVSETAQNPGRRGEPGDTRSARPEAWNHLWCQDAESSGVTQGARDNPSGVTLGARYHIRRHPKVPGNSSTGVPQGARTESLGSPWGPGPTSGVTTGARTESLGSPRSARNLLASPRVPGLSHWGHPGCQETSPGGETGYQENHWSHPAPPIGVFSDAKTMSLGSSLKSGWCEAIRAQTYLRPGPAARGARFRGAAAAQARGPASGSSSGESPGPCSLQAKGKAGREASGHASRQGQGPRTLCLTMRGRAQLPTWA